MIFWNLTLCFGNLRPYVAIRFFVCGASDLRSRVWYDWRYSCNVNVLKVIVVGAVFSFIVVFNFTIFVSFVHDIPI
ncbi:MAG: hypothetical protein LBT90_02325 [Holosporaceae bacterium]|nr:hypothetical protein [Holosporaceae bacterium]